MNRKTSSTLLFVGLSSLSFGSIKKDSKPNIIFIFADDLGYGDISCLNSSSKIQTPNIDKFAQEGQTYTDAHSGSSVSTPSRYCVITGRYAWRTSLKHGVLQGFSKPLIEKDRPTVASFLKENGYTTTCIGKWHLGMTWATKSGSKIDDRKGLNVDFTSKIKDTPVDRGFDYYYGISASLDMPPYVLIENNRVTELPDSLYTKGRRLGYGVKSQPFKSILPSITKKAVQQINHLSKDKKPFFMYFALNAPHTPVAPIDKFKGASKAGDYGDYVVEVDDVVKQIMNTLKENNIDENTLVIISSDNGPEVICYGRAMKYGHYSSGILKGVKRDLWEGGHRVPFFIRWPKHVKSGKTIKTPICLIDFYATVADLLNVKLSKNEAPDSYSFLPLMKSKKRTTRPYIIHHSCSGHFAIRKGDWVYLEGYGNDNKGNKSSIKYYISRKYNYSNPETSLYNLKKDIREFKDVKDKYPKKVNELKTILDKAKK